MKPEQLVPLEQLWKKFESSYVWQSHTVNPGSKEKFLAGARAALDELGIVMVQDCTVSLKECPLRKGDNCACMLTKGAVLVRAKEKEANNG